MTLSDISIKNPVFAWMIMIGLIVFGAISFSRMGISQLPDVDFPMVTISTTWAGASPETMESAVSDVIEDAVMSIEGIRNVNSTSQEGISNVSIEFELDRNVNVAVQDIQSKLSQAQRMLPTDIDPPVVTKTNPEDQPILWTALTGDAPLRTMVLFIRDRLKDAITTISGVGEVRLGGYVEPNMRIWLDAKKMMKQEISVDDVIAGINSQHLLTPSGFIDNGQEETNLRVLSEARTAEDFSKLIIPTRSGAPIWRPLLLSQVATAEEGLADVRRISRMNGTPSVGLGIIKQRGSNAVAVGDSVKKEIAKLQPTLPKGMKMGVVTDSTQFIKESTHELLFTLGLSAILTSIVCYLFLGSWISAFNVILAIPTSLIGSFIILYFCGFTLNTFTLLGLSLSIGIVVDDAIMVLENIVRHKEMGKSKIKAAIIGAREITTAAVSASFAILAIFAPVVFMKGAIGKFFFQFGITISVAVMLSLLEALTLAPMRCSQFLDTGHDSWVGKRMDRLMSALSNRYRKILEWSLQHRWKILLSSFVLFFASIKLLGGVSKEFVPPQDQSRFLMNIQTPLGSSIGFTDDVFKKIEVIMKSRPEIETYFDAIGGFQGGIVNQGIFFITLKHPEDRPILAPFKHRPTQQELMAYIRDEAKKVPGVRRAMGMDLSLSGFSGGRNYPITFSIEGPDWDKLSEISQILMKKLTDAQLMSDADSDYKLGMPEIKVIPDRAKAAAHGVTISKIANTITATIGSLRIGKYTDLSGHRNDIRVKLLDEYNKTAEDIGKIYVRNMHGQLVRLSELVRLEKKPSLLTISRHNRERAISIFGNIPLGKSQTEVMKDITRITQEQLPEGYHMVLSGNSQAFKESFQSLFIALILGIFVAYMVLGSQFNSLIHPITVLLSLPFSLTGAFIALRITGVSLNIYSMIGLLLLMGIVKKNAILLVDFTNERRKEGFSVHNALLDACPTRLRPILMTSIATVAGVIPAALALGPGAETTRPMAVVVIGGVLLSTILTLVIIPCAYSLLSRIENSRHRKELNEALVELGEIAPDPQEV